MEINSGARLIINELKKHGFEGYLVGGCTRDYLLGIEPHDWDICTNAEPEKVKEIFKEYTILEIGIAYGTITVVINHEYFEVTTYRIDGEYVDGRHPVNTELTNNLVEDLSRRDFTVNAIAFDGDTIVDIFGGQIDLKNKLIRCVGDPYKRFDEDRLRILRAIRFSCKLNFEIEENTFKAMKELAPTVRQFVSAERLQNELTKLLETKYLFERLHNSKLTEIFGVIFPEFAKMFGFVQNSIHHKYDVWGHTLKAVENADTKLLKFVALMHDMGKPLSYSIDEEGNGHFYNHAFISYELANEFLQELKFSNFEKDHILAVILHHHDNIDTTRKAVLKYLSKHDYSILTDVVYFRQIDVLAQSEYQQTEKLQWVDNMFNIISSIIRERKNDCNIVFNRKDLKINGKDLLSLGFESGPSLGKILDIILQAVIDGNVNNEKEELISFVLNLKI